jgi:hypothetical protein
MSGPRNMSEGFCKIADWWLECPKCERREHCNVDVIESPTRVEAPCSLPLPLSLGLSSVHLRVPYPSASRRNRQPKGPKRQQYDYKKQQNHSNPVLFPVVPPVSST